MEKGIELSHQERLNLMKSIYSIFYRDNSTSSLEVNVLNKLSVILNVKKQEYAFNVSINEIVYYINNIDDIRVRIYFMEIIKEVYRKEINTIFKNPLASDNFKNIYLTLEKKIDTVSNSM